VIAARLAREAVVFFTRVEQSDQFQLRLTLGSEVVAEVQLAQAVRAGGVIDLGKLLSNRGRPSLAGVRAVVIDLDAAGERAVREALAGGEVDLGLEILWEDDSLLGTYLLRGARGAEGEALEELEELEELEAEVRVVLEVKELGFE
jgi:hypothetical protein